MVIAITRRTITAQTTAITITIRITTITRTPILITITTKIEFYEGYKQQ